MAQHRVMPIFFDDLHIGDEWVSPARTVTETDVVAFAGISGDFNPLHMDHETARAGAFGQPVAHGLLGLAMVSGLSMHAPLVATLAFVAIDRWDFLKPIAFGDTVHVLTRVDSITPRARNRRAEVVWHRQLINQRGETVQDGLTRTLVKGRITEGSANREQPAAD